MKRPKRTRRTFGCPHCGAEVAVGARACRECGSDASTGWQDDEEIDYQSLDIPDGYGPDEGSTRLPARSRPRWWAIAAVVAAAAFLWWALRR